MRLSPVIDHVSRGHRLRGGMLAVCTEPGCTMLTMGGTCVAHDPPVTIVFPRGRPFSPERFELGDGLTLPAAHRAPVP